MRGLPALLFTMIILLASLNTSIADYTPDPGPLVVMLIDAINALNKGDCSSVISIADTALSVNTTSGLSYLHTRSWSTLREICIVLRNTSLNPSSNETIYTLYRLKIEAEDVIPGYADSLVNMIANPSTRYRLQRTLYEYLSSLSEILDNLVEGFIKNNVNLEFSLIAPDQVEAGDRLTLTLVFPREVYLEKLGISVKIDGFTNTSLIYIGLNTSMYMLEVDIPDTSTGIYGSISTEGYIVVTAYGFSDNPFVSIQGKRLEVLTEEPPLYFTVPSIIRIHENLTVDVESKAHIPLILNVSMVDDRDETVLLNSSFIVKPGRNEFTINTETLMQGLYTIVFKVSPVGKYLPAQYSKSLLITGILYGMQVDAPRIVIGPPFTVLISINPPSNAGTLIISIKEDDATRLMVNNSANGVLVYQLPIRTALLMEPRYISIKVETIDGEYVSYQFRIYVLNFLSLILTVTALLVLSSISLKEPVLSFANLVEALSRKQGSLSPVTLYRKLVLLLSTYVKPPSSSETLREYYKRASTRIETIAVYLWRFIELYERYLYSRRKPLIEELRRAYEEFRGMIK
ncbi:DUF4129 domain-containing protein [Desulfurococcus amylolyticus]|uniref:Protein-glutamine gamma-glutamyltransferase-like C-terminal domain-containing protein n=1 Tax=Desulfurococcus amylolyticus DSM 16532 TaxID=768672 RepID=I3XS85_DESAM|nr:DUF4129 domain-containing protein [Desulfurococcus amylolyticus]AFL66809.1 hypothetical protein Desfe_0921 [Desulfurococcus amylolyticus DSM 16532]